MLFLVKKFPIEEESVKWCNSEFFCSQSSGWSLCTFLRSRHKSHSSMWNWLFGLEVKENDEHALGFAVYQSCLSSVSLTLDFPCMAHAFFPEHLSDHCQGIRRTFSEICTKFDAVPLPDASRNHIRLGTGLLIKEGQKNQHVHPVAWNFVHWLPKYANTVASHYYNCCTDGSTVPEIMDTTSYCSTTSMMGLLNSYNVNTQIPTAVYGKDSKLTVQAGIVVAQSSYVWELHGLNYGWDTNCHDRVFMYRQSTWRWTVGYYVIQWLSKSFLIEQSSYHSIL
jgi:hypothetical protein